MLSNKNNKRKSSRNNKKTKKRNNVKSKNRKYRNNRNNRNNKSLIGGAGQYPPPQNNDYTYEYIATLGTTRSRGSSNTQFSNPTGVAVSAADNRIYVVEY